MKQILFGVIVSASLTLFAGEPVWLSSLDLTKMSQDLGAPQKDKSARKTPLKIAGAAFERGVGTCAKSVLWIQLGGGSEKFLASVGIDDVANNKRGVVAFDVSGAVKVLWNSGLMRFGDPAKAVDLDVRGIQKLLLRVSDRADTARHENANWADARLIVSGQAPRAIDPPGGERLILTPQPDAAPRINGPKVYGCRPSHPFLYRIPATGERPMEFSASGLPQGLKLDGKTGIISGAITKAGSFMVTLCAVNSHAKAERPFKIVCGDTLALTPPMGWNHWYAHYHRITDAMMRRAADEMVRSGMADAGYQYVCIDDCWMNAEKHKDAMREGPLRDANGNILPNKHFPDMKGLTDYIHAKGLKAGIYTSPGPCTCGGYAGSYQHEAQDAKQFANWGFDLLKYDRCSYREVIKNDASLEAEKKPYILMGRLLQEQNRDIIFNLCQYGISNVWEWGAEAGGHSWRTGRDLGHSLNQLFEVALKNSEYRQWSKPGSWNDPDYIQIGFFGKARGGGMPEPCRLSPNEQYAFMSLWCLMAAPLFYSGDMERLDPFTLNVLCNTEVIEVDQDPLGQSARVIRQTEDTFVMVKDLEDGSKAVGLCNAGEWPKTMSAAWSDLGVEGKRIVRDLWRQKDLGEFAKSFQAEVPRRGVVLVRLR